jgi:hypothetical protein
MGIFARGKERRKAFMSIATISSATACGSFCVKFKKKRPETRTNGALKDR